MKRMNKKLAKRLVGVILSLTVILSLFTVLFAGAEGGKIIEDYYSVKKFKDGGYYLVVNKTNEKVNETGVFRGPSGWYYVERGKVNFKAQGIYQNQYGWWKTTDGEVTFKENSIYQNEFGWWKCKDSKVDFNANGKVTYNGKTYNVKNGKATLS